MKGKALEEIGKHLMESYFIHFPFHEISPLKEVSEFFSGPDVSP